MLYAVHIGIWKASRHTYSTGNERKHTIVSARNTTKVQLKKHSPGSSCSVHKQQVFGRKQTTMFKFNWRHEIKRKQTHRFSEHTHWPHSSSLLGTFFALLFAPVKLVLAAPELKFIVTPELLLTLTWTFFTVAFEVAVTLLWGGLKALNLLTFEGGLLEVDGMSDGAFLLLLTFVLSCEGCTGPCKHFH